MHGKNRAARRAARAANAVQEAADTLFAGRETGTMPTKAEVLSFIASQAGEVGKREIARAFGLDADQKLALKDLLQDLESEGALDRRRRRMHVPGALPGVVLADITARTGVDILNLPATKLYKIRVDFQMGE